MKRTIKSMLAVTLAIAISLVSFNTVAAGEQLGATDFEDGIALPWHTAVSGTGSMDFEVSNGQFVVTINNPGGRSNGGTDRWDCQVRHRDLTIVEGHQYHVHYEMTSSSDGLYYTKIGNYDGNIEVWHNNSDGTDLDATWDRLPITANETKVVDLVFTAGQTVQTAEWAFHLGGDGQYTDSVCFPAGTTIAFDNMSLVDLTSDENDSVAATASSASGIMVNQVGYMTGRAKRATLVSDSTTSIEFYIKNESGETVFTGESEPFGADGDSGYNVHILDFTAFDEAGTYTLEAATGEVSRAFGIGNFEDYNNLLDDSLNYFYQNRSGIAIESQYITSGDADALARAAGHAPDQATISEGGGTMDVTGGWYDAGDHGKYVVNGGISLWLLQNMYETSVYMGTESMFADGTMAIPENANGYPDLLDEARWEMEWMMTMLVQSGDYQDMVYHKVHDEAWTGLALAPADDTQPRVIYAPSTAATLNVSACAAQAARLWRGIDDDFADACLDIAVRTYAAAQAHPDMYAPLESPAGGGAYGDDNVTDEFYWASCELYITTGEQAYLDDMNASSWFVSVPTSLGGGESVGTYGSFDWGHVSALGNLSLVINPDSLDDTTYETLKNSVLFAANTYVTREADQGFGQPYAPSSISYDNSNVGYIWGSNSFVADNSIVIGYAYLLTGDTSYIDGVVSGLDYLLGRNPLDISYVTGYGSYTAQNPHHRFWANSLDPSFPSAPAGVLVGGPNGGMEDPYVQSLGWQPGVTAPATCYADNIEAYSVNECTINWNAPLCWVTSFVISTDYEIFEPAVPEDTSEETEETTEETEVTVDEDVRSEPSAAAEVKDQVEPASKGNIVKVLVPASLTVACIACAFAVFATVVKKKKK